MKRFLFGLLSIVAAMPLLADNTVTVSSVSGAPGDEVEISLGLSNTDEVVAAEFIIPLDKNISYVDGSARLNSGRSNGHLISASGNDDVLRVYIYSIANAALSGNEGTLCTFKLKLGKRADVLTLNPSITLSSASGSAIAANVVAGSVSVLIPELTISTASIDFGHVPIRGTYQRNLVLKNSGTARLHITGIVPSAAELSAADEDFYIEVGDTRSVTLSFSPVKHGAIAESIRVVSDAANGTQQATVIGDPYSVNELRMMNASGNCDSEVTIGVKMNNMEPIVAAQFTLTLPDALQYVPGSVSAGEHAEGLSATATVNGNKLTLFLYSSNNNPIAEGDGEILTFRLNLQGQSGTYYLTPSQVTLSNTKMQNMVSAVYGSSVTVASPKMTGSTTLNIGTFPVNEDCIKEYHINNNGQTDLVISNITFLAEGFCIQETLPLSIAPWNQQTIHVVYTPSAEGNVNSVMNIYTNDPTKRLFNVAITGRGYEPNTIALTGRTKDTETYHLDVSLDNYSEIVGAQLDLHLPDGFETSAEKLIATDRLSDLSYTIMPVTDNTYRVVIFSLNNNKICGNEGAIFGLDLTGDVQMADGESITIDNVVLSNRSGNNYSSTLTPVEHIVRFTLPGDANGDGRVSVADLTAIAGYLLGSTATDFVESAADANGDGRISVADLTAIANKLMNNY